MTPETAFVVIGIAEEYSLLGAKGLQVAKQSLLQTDRGPVDALDVVNPTNNETQHRLLQRQPVVRRDVPPRRRTEGAVTSIETIILIDWAEISS